MICKYRCILDYEQYQLNISTAFCQSPGARFITEYRKYSKLELFDPVKYCEIHNSHNSIIYSPTYLLNGLSCRDITYNLAMPNEAIHSHYELTKHTIYRPREWATGSFLVFGSYKWAGFNEVHCICKREMHSHFSSCKTVIMDTHSYTKLHFVPNL